ncbi:MAG: PQQ-binding-like beta-propeller repeat protein [Solirubrobacteraceae bacterium]
MRRLLKGPRARIALGVLILLIAAGAASGVYVYQHRRAGSVYHPHARFVPETTPTAPPKAPPDRFVWPFYGYTKEHTRFFPASERLRPPFRQLWERNDHALLEFPPSIYGERLYQLADDATLYAIDKHNGKTLWKTRIGELSASTPAVTAATVYATVLKPGRIVALDAKTGRERWSRALPSRTESSPLLDHGHLYFGSEAGTVYALDATDGRPLWTYHAAGPVKASPTLSDGTLYFGDYSGNIQAISARDGRLIWRSSSGGGLLGGGNFYSTSAVFYGRVFLGSTDGRIYAYDAATGRLDWAVQTGSYVYASPAVTNAPGLGPTIYLGSYTGTFYALNARSGAISWSFGTGGKISGSATIIGRVIYFADLGHHDTYGLGISTGRVLFEKHTGAFDPVVSDGKNIYLTGLTGLFGLTPR